MNILRTTLVLLALLLGSMATTALPAAPGDEAGALLEAYDAAPAGAARVAAARRFFALLQEEGLSDEEQPATMAMAPDSLDALVWYWAMEHYHALQRYGLAASHGRRALALMEGGDDKVAQADCLNLLSVVSLRQGDTRQAVYYAQRCYELDLESGDADNISSSLNTLAGIYLGARLPQEAEQYVLLGIDYARQAGNEGRLAVLQGMAAEVYHALGNHQRALDYAREALEAERRLGRADREAVRLSQMAAALTGLRRYDEAETCLRQALPRLLADGNMHSAGICCNEMGEVMRWKDYADSAAIYFARGADIFLQLGDPYNEVHSQLGLYNVLKDSLPHEAMAHLERHNALKDTIYSREAAQRLGEVSAEVDNATLQAASRHHEARAHRWRTVGLALAVLLALTGGGAWLLMGQRNRRFARQLSQLSSSIDELTAQNQRLRHVEAPAAGTAPTADGDDAFVRQVRDIVERQIGEGHIDVAAMAREMCMSITAFRRRFTALIDEKPQAYVMRLRMEKAARLLDEQPDRAIADVGFELGFDDKSNFTRAFKRVYGMTPSDYVKRHA